MWHIYKVRNKKNYNMTKDKIFHRPLLIGVGPRIAVAIIVAALLWLGFVWATTYPGTL
tara:strand:- start:327 stop:500 length:174 start_codon:yes stop_codon:yes gene_type:complete